MKELPNWQTMLPDDMDEVREIPQRLAGAAEGIKGGQAMSQKEANSGMKQVHLDVATAAARAARQPYYTTGALIGAVTAWALTVIVLGTILGAWVKIFWLGWVFAGAL